MKSCKICANEDCTWRGHTDHISVGCLGFEPQTNADRIRAMSDEELAEKIAGQVACMECPISQMCGRTDIERCIDVWLSWLKAPADKEGE